MLKKTNKKAHSKKRRTSPVKKPKVLLASEDRRNKLIQAKVSAKQKDNITANAKACGMSVSDFILSRCYGYEPKALLTPEQEEKLQVLPCIRADLANVVNALGALSPEHRIRHFQNFTFMQAYIDESKKERIRISRLLDEFNHPNDFAILHQQPTVTVPAT